MKTQFKSVLGIYPTWHEAEHAVAELQNAGFTNSDISVLVQAENIDKDALSPERHTQAPRGLALGAVGGAVVGGGIGLAAGLGALIIPGIGPILAAGPIISFLTGVGMGGAAGGVAGAFVGVGFPEDKSAQLNEHLQNGNVIVSVHAESPELRREAVKILEETLADGITHSEESNLSSVDDLRPIYQSTLTRADTMARDEFSSRKQF